LTFVVVVEGLKFAIAGLDSTFLLPLPSSSSFHFSLKCPLPPPPLLKQHLELCIRSRPMAAAAAAEGDRRQA
jgi:hypothetical protein